VLALAVGGLAAYQALSTRFSRGVQLKENVEGRVQDAVDDVKALIEDNTR
jgi:hypothetical protein